jgi:hypothetical protein
VFFAVGFGAAAMDYLGPACAAQPEAGTCGAAGTAMKLLGALLLACVLVTVLTLPRRRNG